MLGHPDVLSAADSQPLGDQMSDSLALHTGNSEEDDQIDIALCFSPLDRMRFGALSSSIILLTSPQWSEHAGEDEDDNNNDNNDNSNDHDGGDDDDDDDDENDHCHH